MGLIDSAKQWLIGVAARKMVIKGVAVAVTWLGSGIAAGYLNQAGVHYDQAKLQEYLTGAALVGLKGLEDWLNLKFGWNI